MEDKPEKHMSRNPVDITLAHAHAAAAVTDASRARKELAAFKVRHDKEVADLLQRLNTANCIIANQEGKNYELQLLVNEKHRQVRDITVLLGFVVFMWLLTYLLS